MYGTGQYDYEIYQVLLRIETLLTGVSNVLSFISENWFPIVLGGIFTVAVISLLHWLVKI